MLKNMSLRFSSNAKKKKKKKKTNKKKTDAYRHIISLCYQVKHLPECYIAFQRGHILFRSLTFVTINFSVPIMAGFMKPCIVIALDMLYKYAP